MSLEFALRPSSIEGIKRLADRIQRDEAPVEGRQHDRAPFNVPRPLSGLPARPAIRTTRTRAVRLPIRSYPSVHGTTSTSQRTGTICPPGRQAVRRW